MDATLVIGLIIGLGAGLAVALVGRAIPDARGGSRPAAADDPARTAAHEATVRAAVDAAVDTVVKVAGERFAAHADAGSRELAARSEAFEQRVGDLRGRVTDELALRNAAVEAHMGDVRAELARMADDVLRAAGLVEGISYRKQSATAAGTVPDFTFLLPGGRVLHMDVKFPVDNYLRYLEAASDRERDQYAIAFVRDVRARVRELSGRVYIDPDDTLDEVLLFIPNESVYAFVHTQDRELVEVSLRQKVVLCSPCTLFSVLAVIRQA